MRTEGTLVERAIEAVIRVFSPEAATHRARQRAVREHHALMAQGGEYAQNFYLSARLRGYKAAGSAKNQTPWLHESDRSADAELVGDLRKLRNRSRALSRDDAVGSGVVSTLRRGAVGTGLRPQARTGIAEKNEALEAVWSDRADQLDRANVLDHGAHQALVYQRTIEDGDVLLRPVISEPGDPVWIEVVEADRIDTPLDAKPRDPKGRIVAGVEKNAAGVPVAYWVAKRHPGDTAMAGTVLGSDAKAGSLALTSADFDRVDAAQVRMVRSRVTRPGQTRGAPLFHACLQDLHDLDLLILASLKRTQVAACLSLFITSGENATDLLELTAEDYGYQLDQSLTPGGIFRLFPGETIDSINPTVGTPELEKFVFLLAQRIGATIGLSPQAILRAWQGVTYSGARTIKIDDRQTTRGERSSLARQALAWEWRVVQEDALLRGDDRLRQAGVTVDDLGAVEWIGDEEQWVDPQAEASATQLMLEMGLTSLQIECARLGRDWQDVMRQKLEAEKFESDLRKELGLSTPKPALKVIPGGKPADEDEQPTTAKEAA